MGAPELRSPAGDSVRFRTRKHLAFLVYLAVEPRTRHRRDRLADLLWPRAGSLEGRHSVATALSVLRGKLGSEAFEASRDHIRFIFSELDLDLDRLSSGDVLGDEFNPTLDMGGFLDDFEIGDAPDFQVWREQQRGRWLPEIRVAFVRLLDLCRRTGDFVRSEFLADRLLALDDLNEEAIRAKMEARAFAGDRLGALRLFEGWRSRLHEEFGAVPSALIDGMAIRLRRRGWEQTGTIPLPPVFTDRWKGRPFVGRGKEYRKLYEVWERTLRSSASNSLVLGDSGIGKSTLVERLVTAAGLEGAVSSRVQCYELERDIPYAAMGGLIRSLLDRPEISGTPAEWLAELCTIAPDLKARFTSLPKAPETEGETARIRLAEAVHQLMMTVAEEHPLILVVDDVHLADDVSVAVLHLLMRRTQSQRIMVVLTARPGELARAPSAARLRENEVGLRLEVFELPPLTREESAEVVDGLARTLGRPPSASVRRALVHSAAGIPMVLELLFRDWQTTGDGCLALSVGAMTANVMAGGSEDAYGRILDRMVADLDDASHAVLNLASILGARLNDLRMYQLVDLSMAQTIAGMSRLTEHRLLGDAGRLLEFRNEMIRAHAYFGVPSPLRTALHGRIASLLLEGEARGETVSGLEIAWHCIRSGQTEASTPYLLRGAREALHKGAPFEAEQGLASAMAWLRGEARMEAMLILAEALQEQARWMESREALEKEDGTLTEGQRDRWKGLRLVATLRTENLETASTRGVASELLDILRTSHSIRARLLAATNLAGMLDDVRDRRLEEEALDAIEQLLPLTEGEDRANVLVAKGILLFLRRDRIASKACVAEARSVIEEAGVTSSLKARCQIGGAVLEASEARYETAIQQYISAYETAGRIDNTRLKLLVSANIAVCFARLGLYGEDLDWARRGLAERHRIFGGLAEANAYYAASLAHAMLGKNNEANTMIQELDSRLPESSPPWIKQAWLLYKADLLLLEGQPNDALQCGALALRDHSFRLASEAFAGHFARWAARVAETADPRAYLALRDLVDQRSRFDAKDRIEILNAFVWLETRRERGNDELASQFWTEFRELPAGVATQIDRMGMLDL